MIQYQDPDTLEMHKDMTFYVQKERWEEDEVKAERAGRTIPNDNPEYTLIRD